jgi:hypothetical protein
VIEKRLKFGIKRDEIDFIAKEIEAENLPPDQIALVAEELEAVRQRRADLSNQIE